MAATLKVAVLIVKALVKPIANQLKQNAANPGAFRSICHDYGQFHNNILTRIQLRSQGHHVKNVKKLAESEAVTLGAEVFAEGMVLFVGMTAIGAEVYRKTIADQTAKMEKELIATQKAKAREMKALEADAALRARLLRLEHQVISVEDAKLAAVHDELVADTLRHMSVTEYLIRRVAALEAELRLRPPAPPATLEEPAEDGELAALIPLPEKMGPPLPMAAQDCVEHQLDDGTDIAAAVAAAGIDPLTLAAGTPPPVQLAQSSAQQGQQQQWPQHEHRHGHRHLPNSSYSKPTAAENDAEQPVIIDVVGEEARSSSDHSFAHPAVAALPAPTPAVSAVSAPSLVAGPPPAVSLVTAPAPAPAPAPVAAAPAPAPAPAAPATAAAAVPVLPDSRHAKAAAAATIAAVNAATAIADGDSSSVAGQTAPTVNPATRRAAMVEARRRLVYPPAPGVSSEAEAAALAAAEAAKHTMPTLSEAGAAAVAAVPKVGSNLLESLDSDTTSK